MEMGCHALFQGIFPTQGSNQCLSCLLHWPVGSLPLSPAAAATAAAAAKSLQSCPTLCDPIDGSHQAPPSLGFSRQEPWSGLPLPSPMHESEKWKWSCSVMSDSLRPYGLQPTRPLHPWDFPGKSTGVGCHCLLCRRYIYIYIYTHTHHTHTSHTYMHI